MLNATVYQRHESLTVPSMLETHFQNWDHAERYVTIKVRHEGYSFCMASAGSRSVSASMENGKIYITDVDRRDPRF